MLTKVLRKLFAKVATFALVVTMLAPVTGLVQAGPQEGTVRVGINMTEGAFEVYAITYNEVLEEVELVLAMDSSTCGLVFENDGYYCEDVLGTGAYEIRFSPYEDYDLGIYKNGDPSATYWNEGKLIANFQLTTVGIEIYGSYGGNLHVGTSIAEGDFEVYAIVYNEVLEENELVLMMSSDTCSPVFDTDGYYCTMYGAPTGAYEVRFAPYGDYSIGVYKNGTASATYEDGGQTIANFQLTTSGIDILANYGGTLRVGTNLDSAEFEVFEIVYNEILEENELVLMMSSDTCGPVFDTNGYYCTLPGAPTGAYTARFTDITGYDLVVYEGGLTHEIAFDGVDKWFANFQLTTAGIDMLGVYFIEEEPLELQVGVNIEEGGFSVYSNADLVTPLFTATGIDCTYDVSIEYFVCTYTEADGIAEGDYTVVFTDAGGEYITPTDQGVTLPTNDPVLGTYITFPSGTVEVQVINQDSFPITVPADSWEIFRCATADPETCTIPVMDGGAGYIQPGLQYGTYRVFVPGELPMGYTSRQILPSQYQELSSVEDYITFTILYTEDEAVIDYSFIEIAVTGPVAMASAEVSVVEDSTTNIVISNESIDNGASETFQVNADEAHTITCHDVAGFDPVTPTINVAGIVAGETATVTCDYIESTTDEAYIEVSVAGPVAMTAAEVSIVEDSTTTTVADHDSIDNGASQTYTVNTEEAHTVTCHDVAGFTTDTPTINVPALAAGVTESVTCQYSEGGGGDDDVDFVITAEDEEGAVMNADFTYDTGTGTTPENVEVDIAELDDFTISFSDVPGYITPEDVVVINSSIDTIPAGVTITINDTPYVAGTEIEENDTIGILGTYEDKVSVSKTTVEESIVNNNKRVNYTITITRNPGDTSTDPLTVSLHDTLSDTSGTLAGSNGGTMTAVLQGSGYSTCSLALCGDIVVEDFDIIIASPGDVVTITYQLLSNNSGIASGQSSLFTNTVTATYDDDTNSVETTNSAQVNVSGPPSSGPTPPTGGGGGGGGGGILIIKGDMILQVEKLVSLDNVNFKDASDPSNPLAMPKNAASSRVYNKVRVTNLGKVSVTDVVFSELFDGGDSGMSADDIENLKGVTMNSDGDVEIEKILVNKTFEFTYSVLVKNTGNNGELANEALVLEDFGSALSKSQDYLTYLGIGDEHPSYLIAGDIKAPVASGDERLKITVTSDKSEANIGDIINLLITAKNLTEDDITSLILTHDYPENALEILNSYGGRDNGRDVQWQRALLRPGEEVTYQIQARVANSAPVGEYVQALTRALVNEFEGIAPVENSLYILGGVASADPDWQLAQTGPAQIFLLLIAFALACLAYKESWRLRYAYVRKQALRPL